MCGLVGIIGESGTPDQVRNVLGSIKHRGPDHSGIDVDEHWVIGHNRLSIIDLDPRSNQPYHSEDKRYTLVFNGEIYNYKKIRKTLQDFGFVFRTESDTEVILYAYIHWNVNSFEKLHGQFAFAIIDRVQQKLTVVRDRFGEKPMFYSHVNGQFSFASDIRCITPLLKDRNLSHEALLDFLHFGYIPAPKTVFENVYKLEPGYFLEYSIPENRVLANRAFYKISFNENHFIKAREKMELFDEIGNDVASQISLADVPVGAFLSGGVDSSGVVYFLRQKQIHTFTAGFKSEKFDETRFSDNVVRHLGVENTKRIIDFQDFEELYDTMIEHYGEPHNDFSFIPTYVICGEAVKNFTVMISGDGADEIFCGYPRFHKLRQFSAVKKIPGLAKAVGTLTGFLPEQSNIRRQLYFAGMSEPDFFYRTMAFNFMPEESTSILGPDLKKSSNHYSSRSIVERYLNELPKDSHILQKQRYLDIKLTLADDMLVKADRASMANSLEVRPFYLHPLVTDFAFSLPVEDLASFRTDKVFLKRYFENKLPYENLYRPKMGFTFPLKELIQGPLANLFDKCIGSLPEELINRKQLSRLLELNSLDNRDYTAQLHSLMALGRWISKNLG